MRVVYYSDRLRLYRCLGSHPHKIDVFCNCIKGSSSKAGKETPDDGFEPPSGMDLNTSLIVLATDKSGSGGSMNILEIHCQIAGHDAFLRRSESTGFLSVDFLLGLTSSSLFFKDDYLEMHGNHTRVLETVYCATKGFNSGHRVALEGLR